MTSLRRLISILCLLLLLVGRCPAEELTGPNTHARLKVGVIAPLSGNLAAYGLAVRNGVQLAIKQSPASFQNIEVYYEDSRYDGGPSVSAFRSLVQDKGVHLIFVWGNTPSEVIAPLAQRTGIPMVAVSTDPEVNRGRPWVISFQAGIAEFGARLAGYLNEQHYSTLAIVKTALPYYLSMAAATEQRLSPSIRLALNEEVPPSEYDFRSLVARLRSYKVDAMGVYLLPGQISEFCRQLSLAGFSMQVFGTEDLATRTDIEKAPTLLEGAVFPGNHVTDEFLSKYSQQYHDDSHIAHAAYAFEFTKFLPIVVNELAGKAASNSSIKAALLHAKIEEGVLGKLERMEGADGELTFTFPVVMRTILQRRATDLKR